jgi:hypothetical protein
MPMFRDTTGMTPPEALATYTEDLERIGNDRAKRLDRIAEIIAEIVERVNRRARFGDVVTLVLQEMRQAEIGAIYALAKGKPEDWRPHLWVQCSDEAEIAERAARLKETRRSRVRADLDAGALEALGSVSDGIDDVMALQHDAATSGNRAEDQADGGNG